jgi:hypothetical protein
LVHKPKCVMINFHYHLAWDNAPTIFFSWCTSTCELDCQMRQINYTITIFKQLFWQCGEIVNKTLIYQKFKKEKHMHRHKQKQQS